MATSDKPLLNKAIIIDNRKISGIVEQENIPAGTAIIDLSDKTVLPGLIDCHTHVLLQGDVTSEDYDAQILKESIAYRTLLGSVACRIAFNEWFYQHTRSWNRRCYVCRCGFKNAISNGVIPGPRMFVATLAINTTGHYPVSNKDYSWELHMPKGLQEITGAMKQEKQYGNKSAMVPTG